MATAAGWTWVSGYDYLAHVWLEGPLRVHEEALLPWLEDLARCDSDLSRDVGDLIRCLDDPAELEAARRDFQSCMVVPLPGSYLPPYASVYLDASKSLWGPVTTRVLSWYNQADLDWVGQSSRYPWVRAPDHLGVECAFAAELWAALDGGPPSLTGLGRTFVAEHLLKWVPSYVEEMRGRVMSSYWRGMAGFLEGWVRKSAPVVPEVSGARSDASTDSPASYGDR